MMKDETCDYGTSYNEMNIACKASYVQLNDDTFVWGTFFTTYYLFWCVEETSGAEFHTSTIFSVDRKKMKEKQCSFHAAIAALVICDKQQY